MKSEKNVQPSNVIPRCATRVVDYVAAFGFCTTVSQLEVALNPAFHDSGGRFDTTILVENGIRFEGRDQKCPGFLTTG